MENFLSRQVSCFNVVTRFCVVAEWYFCDVEFGLVFVSGLCVCELTEKQVSVNSISKIFFKLRVLDNKILLYLLCLSTQIYNFS
jgi:hypothetical protein